MKVLQICLIFFIFSIYITASDLKKFQEKNFEIIKEEEIQSINSFLETSSKTKQSYDLYLARITKMRRKKEIIIKKLYELTPIIGEILALANVEKINLIVNKFFILRETDLLRKYLIMWDVNSNYIINF